MAQQWQIDEAKILDIGNENETVGKLRLTLVAGRVDIVTHDDSPTARLEVHEVAGQPLLVSWDGWTLNISQVKDKSGSIWESVKALGLDKGKRRARISISVPATTDITSSTVSAETLINGVRASVHINTVTGSLTLDDIVGNVDAKTVSGDIECHALEGDFSGNSVSGALTVQASRLRQIKLNTISGDITLDLTDGGAQIQSNSVSGDVTVRVPKGGGYDVAARTASGHVVIDGQSMNGDGDSPHQRGGRLSEGDKALVIKANSVSGNVVVLRTTDIQDTPPADIPRDGLAHEGTAHEGPAHDSTPRETSPPDTSPTDTSPGGETPQGGIPQGGASQGGASQGGASQGGASQGGASQGGAPRDNAPGSNGNEG